MREYFNDCEILEEAAAYLDDGVTVQGKLLSMKVFVSNDLSSGWNLQLINEDNKKYLVTKKTTTIEKINNIASLGENWDGKGAKPIPPRTIDNTIKLLSGLSVIPVAISPTSNQSISLLYTYRNRRLSIDIYEDRIDMIENGQCTSMIVNSSNEINQYLETFF